MFKRKECSKCNKKVSEKTNFCPNCGNSFLENKEDFGMLGKEDSENLFENSNMLANSLLGNLGTNIFGKMLNSTMKMLEKEMQKEMNSPNFNNIPNGRFELFINGKRVNPENIKVSQKRINPEVKKQKVASRAKHFSEEQQQKFSRLLHEEPKTNVKRLSDRVVYEIEIPEVSSLEDISIIPLENSIEIKAISKEKAYAKTLQINFPILSYDLLDKKLILELEAKD